MARLTVQLFLSAGTPFVNKEWAFRTSSLLGMAMMLDRGMPAFWPTQAMKPTLWSNSPAGLRRLQDCSTTIAADFCKDGLRAACTSATMANLLAIVAAAFQSATASSDAYVLRLNSCFWGCISVASTRSLSFSGSLLPCAANFRTFVAATAHVGTTCSSTSRSVFLALMADSRLAGSTATAAYVDFHQATATVTCVAF